ncbi:flagellin [Alteribacillus bidgolensis]|uniref:Flagellin n=1 Tax=Alteribacillus bidgolensis TaxID=930129 RepID=A0A1G8BTV4_9BACI|nr:flagellin [Alteribacillus bidgolensis]SDH36655.1 flagellin [Alteribacillus bidgolensis]
MKINNNIQALNAYRNLNQNQNQVSKNLEKLSSGLRINRASDDAAGLAISEKMRSQIRGLKQSERNSMDGISLMQTSEGAMQEIHSMLQRMRELAVQASNDTNTEYDSEQLQKEILELTKEIDSISNRTEFNTKKLLDGSSAVYSYLDEDKNGAKLASPPVALDADIQPGDYSISVSGKSLKIDGADGVLPNQEDENQRLGEYTIEVEDLNDETAFVTIYDDKGIEIDSQNISDEQSNVGGFELSFNDITVEGKSKFRLEAEGTFKLLNDDGENIELKEEVSTKDGKIQLGDLEFEFRANISDGSSDFQVINNSLAFQIGPNTGQQVMVDIPKMDAEELDVDEVDVSTHDGASKAITQFDDAINQVSDARAKLGAVQNRMEHTVANLQVTHENLTSSESRIRDADMAKEMTEFTRNNIINQSATAMLAQANQLPQGVLQLLQ